MSNRQIARCGVCIALLAVSAWVTVPLGPVPFTLQTFVLALLPQVMRTRDALFTAAKLTCILEEKNMTFPELYSLLPSLFVYSTTAQLELPPDYLDEFEGENFSFGRDGANGFVLVEKRGKTHISPLGNGRFRLTAQSFDEETARELCAEAQAFISSGAK